MFETMYSKVRKRPFLTLCIIITVIYLAIMGVLITLMVTTYAPPADLKTANGTVTKLNYKADEDIIDHIINNSTYFNVTLDDETFFETIGVSFANIEKDFFDKITVGTKITITYEEGNFFTSNKIYGIEYNGKTYLNPDDVLADLENENKSAYIICPVFMGIATLSAAGLIFLSYKKVKPQKEV